MIRQVRYVRPGQVVKTRSPSGKSSYKVHFRGFGLLGFDYQRVNYWSPIGGTIVWGAAASEWWIAGDQQRHRHLRPHQAGKEPTQKGPDA